MGGKSSKTKSSKKAKKSKSNPELDGLSAPEGKYVYDEQATLPRPELNLEGTDVNISNGGKVEIVADGDLSIPNADVDLETTGDISAVADNIANSAHVSAGNVQDSSRNVVAGVSQNVDNLAEKSDKAVNEAGRISGEFQKSAQDAKDHGVNTVNDTSVEVSRRVDGVGEGVNDVSEGFSQRADSVAEGAGDVSVGFSQRADRVVRGVDDVSEGISQRADRVDEGVDDVSVGFSQRADGIVDGVSNARDTSGEFAGRFQESAQNTTSSALETTGEISGEIENKFGNSADHVEEASSRISASFSEKVENAREGVNADLEVAHSAVSAEAGRISGEFQDQNLTQTTEDFRNAAENIDSGAQSVSARLSANAADLAQTSQDGFQNVQDIGIGVVNTYQEDAAYVKAYDDFMAGSLSQFVATSSELGGDIAEMGQLTKACFDSQRDFLVMSSQSKEPSEADLPPLLAPQSEKIQAVMSYTESHRTSKAFNNLNAVSSGIGAIGWVSVKPTPGPHVKDMMDSTLFYSNKVLKEFKGVNETQVQWCKSLTGVFNELIAYIRQHHTTGVSWNPQGGTAYVPGASGAAPKAAPSAGGAPPPPPPPPPVPVDLGNAPSSGGDDGRSALFESLNKGDDVTKGLKKVTDDMKTHKNPGLRQGPAPFKPNKSPSSMTPPKAPKPAPVVAAKPPRTELEGGKKWLVEYHNGNPKIEITETNMKQVVYIYKCMQSSVVIKGKVNSVIVDSCKKVGVVVDDVISSVEFVNCQSVQGQILGAAPTVSIDKTDGCMVYLSKASLEANIVTAKSSEMNILVPAGDGDFTEFPVPEQFKTTWNGKALVTEATDIAG